MESYEKLIETKCDEDKDELLGLPVSHIVQICAIVIHAIVDIRFPWIVSTIITWISKVAVLLPNFHHHTIRTVRTLLKKQTK